MPVEAATYIHDFVSANPLVGDALQQGDDHLRLVKAVLQNTFPNLTGAVTAAQADLNAFVPVGGIILWSGSVAAIPAHWQICDGTNGTPDLRDRFVVGAGNSYTVGASGGALSAISSLAGSHDHGGASQGHALTIAELPPHSHLGGYTFLTGALSSTSVGSGVATSFGSASENVVGSGTAHSHNITAASDHSHTVDTRSPYYALAFIQRIS